MTIELKLSPQEHRLMLVALGMACGVAVQQGNKELSDALLRLAGIVEQLPEAHGGDAA